MISDAGQRIGEPGLRIDAVEFGGFDQRVGNGGSLVCPWLVGLRHDPALLRNAPVTMLASQNGHCQSKFVYFAKISEPDFVVIYVPAFFRVDLSGSMAAPSI
jgi:hypothetical protein